MNLGLPEMLFIGILILLIFGPKRLPEIGRSLGKGINEFRRASNNLRDAVVSEVDAEDRKAREAEAPRILPPAGTAPRDGTAAVSVPPVTPDEPVPGSSEDGPKPAGGTA